MWARRRSRAFWPRSREAKLIRLQCYEGFWTRATPSTNGTTSASCSPSRAASEAGEGRVRHGGARYSREEFLLERPLLEAIRQDEPPVLLIDEIDRADEEFEAYLLEILSDFQITIPELGTIIATARPLVILTSNGTRDLSDALRRRCIYSYVDYPDRATENRHPCRPSPPISRRI